MNNCTPGGADTLMSQTSSPCNYEVLAIAIATTTWRIVKYIHMYVSDPDAATGARANLIRYGHPYPP